MPYCLGLHIEDNLIKFAKVQVEKDSIPKVGSHGIVFYDNLHMAVEQIIKETYSQGVDVAVNLKNEMYDYTEVFSGIRQNSLKKHLELFFAEEICTKKNITPNFFESRFILGKKKHDEDKVEVIYISANKSDINLRKQELKLKLKKMLPLSVANLELLDLDDKVNAAILNFDSVSTLTIILQGKIKKIININIGMSNVLSSLNQKYGSYAKSYKRCKSITLNSELVQENISEDDKEDIDKIEPLLYDLSQRVDSLLTEYTGIVNKLYITGTGVAINNIDLYFEEQLNDINVEILKPNFIANNVELSGKIKEYTEVNSAIALVVSSGKVDGESINFIESSPIKEKLSGILDNKFISNIKEKFSKKKNNQKVKEFELKVKTSFWETTLAKFVSNELFLTLLVLIMYLGINIYLSNKYKENTKIINEEKSKIMMSIDSINADINFIASNKLKYDNLKSTLENSLQDLSGKNSEINGLSYDVPNLLTQIALFVPDEVIINEINISANKMVNIQAECETYAPLGFFISELKNNQVLNNITIDTSEREDGIGQIIVVKGEIL